MPLTQIIKVAIQALRTNKTRSLLTMLGVIIGVSSVILLVSVGSGLQKYITDQLEGVGSNLLIIMPGKLDLKTMGSSGGKDIASSMLNSKLELKDAQNLQSGSEYIKAVVPGVAGQAILKYNEQKVSSEAVGLTANFSDVVNSPLAAGDYFTDGDDKIGKKVVILGSDVAKNLFGFDDPIGQKVVLSDERFTVVGVLKNKGVGSTSTSDQVVIPLTTAERLFNQTKMSAIYAQATSSDKMDLAISEAQMILENRLQPDDFTILTQKEILSTVSSILGVLTAALGGIAAISLLVGGIGIMNIMLVSVTERTREIGLRKALGATPNIILTQFLIESVILSVGGGLIGILIGGAGSLALSKAIPSAVTPWSVLLAFGVSVGVGIVFGVMPARRAAKLNPIEALRYE